MMSVMFLPIASTALDADQLLADLVDVVDAAADVGGDDAFAERVECFPRRRSCARRQWHGSGARTHFDEIEQQRRAALVVDAHSRQLGARRLSRLRVQLDFETFVPGLAGERAAQMLANELGVVGVDELGERLALEAKRIVAADECSEPVVGEHHVLAMHGQRFVQAAEQADQRALALADHQFLHRHLFEEAVGIVGETAGDAAGVHAIGITPVAHDVGELIGCARQCGGTALAPDEHAKQHQNRESQSNSQSP